MAEALSDHRHVGEVWGEGMLFAVELVKDKAWRHLFDSSDRIGPQIAAAMLQNDHVIARAMPQGTILGIAPPLCLNRSEADTIVAATQRAVQQLLG